MSSWASRPYKGRQDAGPKGIVRSEGVGPSRPLRITRPSTVRVYHSATSAQSLSSVLIRATCPYEGRADAGPRGMAAGQGLEPRFTASEAAVLPLDDPALVRKARVERASREV